MHSAVLQNKKYIQFAKENTVEVMSMSSLERGIEAGDRRAATYKEKVGGQEVEYLVEFPGLTVDEMLALKRSRAGQYNKTGKIPYTALVDPHTLEEIQSWSGGQSGSTLIKAATEARRALTKEHGKSMPRKSYRAVRDGDAEITALTEAGDLVGAFEVLATLQKKHTKHAKLEEMVAAMRTSLLGQVEARLDVLERNIESGASRETTKELRSLGKAVRGTDLAERVAALQKQAKGTP